jgi:hypothetical protein
MKIRTGFVSNSSSSSFLVCAFKINKAIMPENWEEIKDEVYVDYRIGDDLIGISIERLGDEEYLVEINPKSFGIARKEVKKMINKYNIKVDEKDIKIYVGAIYG